MVCSVQIIQALSKVKHAKRQRLARTRLSIHTSRLVVFADCVLVKRLLDFQPF
ncbi:hypothetical protein Mal33_47280 [Rosistilla oblonga]|uniref:Uncharacterized protein n=1 Tax=Rosistilla oblonga TaxID=2527990 RepID=A0A518J030_9BACT|nr:hypothetical protein Mal33_47280 [Rosistilla oblonga]